MNQRSRSTGRGRSGRKLPERLSAPYNFVPLSRMVVYPEWGPWVSHDVPFKDGISGQIDVRLRLHTATCVRDGSSKEGRFFTLPSLSENADPEYAIPGTELRGMLRNVVQIATFSRMAPVNDHRFAIRDLTNRNDYLGKLQQNGRIQVCAGWLSQNMNEIDSEDNTPQWQIKPCNFAKVEYGKIKQYAGDQGNSKYNPNRKNSAAGKYRLFKTGGSCLDARATVVEEVEHGVDGRIGVFGTVSSLVSNGEKSSQGVSGRLVFTGQPQERKDGEKNKKHHDWFFYGDGYELINVPYQVKKDFRFIHSAGLGQRAGVDHEPNDEWKYWQDTFSSGGGVPVFFLPSGNSVNQLDVGLACMFRLAYQNSVGDLLSRQQRAATDDRLDFSDLLFGCVEDDDSSHGSLRGRVSVSVALPDESHPPVTGKTRNGVLAAPKASFTPAYLKQKNYDESRAENHKDKFVYSTYMSPDAQLRGWKRYVQRLTEIDLPKIPVDKDGKKNTKVATFFTPIESGAEFTFLQSECIMSEK